MEEIWKDLPGYGNMYQASSAGRIKRKAYILKKRHANGSDMLQHISERIIQPKTNNRGYWQVRLYVDGICHNMLLHRVIGMVFISNPDNLPQINHLDEDKNNNKPDNLEWCTNIYNRHYGTGLRRSIKNHNYEQYHYKRSIPIIQHNIDGAVIREWKSIKRAANSLGVREENIRRCINGVGRTAYGYVWKKKHDIAVLS